MTDSGQFRFDPDTYMETMLEELPAYRDLQAATAEATVGAAVEHILELGVGTGETTAWVLERHPTARVRGIDENTAMLAHAQRRHPTAELIVGALEDALPPGPYDLVMSALAVHHLDGQGKAELFERVIEVLRPGGRFVLADVIVPEDPGDVVTPIDGVYDQPSSVAEHLEWLTAAGFEARVSWAHKDLAVFTADVP